MNDVLLLREAADASLFGGKAANLAKMLQAGLPVPDGFAIGLDAFDSSGRLTERAKEQLAPLINSEKLYAVRSSALAEDAEGASWAGQFETFLDTGPENIIAKTEECHNSAKARAKAYADDKTAGENFDIAVVVQEMLKPEYAGVLFTKDPVSGKDQFVTEYVAGLGEELVSGRADPKRVVLNDDNVEVPFDASQLVDLANKAEQLFGMPQDIEWVWTESKIWLVQARPITATQKIIGEGYYLGEPGNLFYWGPTRTQPMYMSDWLAAAEKVFVNMAEDPDLPTPPKTLVLFCDRKMVYLNNAEAFGNWCAAAFEAYKSHNLIDTDQEQWKQAVQTLDQLSGPAFLEAMVKAWSFTIFAEFSLYGAESNIAKQLSRFDAPSRQEIWGAFTVPDDSTFLGRIDAELAQSKDPAAMAEKYPWIQDGYDGPSQNAVKYFEKRLKIIGAETAEIQDYEAKRRILVKKLGLTDEEVAALTLTRKLAEFMDDRKAWMMRTRRLIKQSASDIEYGWFFNNGKTSKIGKEHAHGLWQRYVEFKASTNAVVGIVASNGGRHFINGEIVVVGSPTDAVANDKILVVPFTSPSYVPLMRSAKALITDHGGMMSHAAIVAREFNLPCIVGTKQATKVLKDGDKVVLDLVRGEVNR